jgi:hypothetical protein
MTTTSCAAVTALAPLLFSCAASASAQAGDSHAPVAQAPAATPPSHHVDVAWNRFYDYPEIVEICRKLAAAWPEYVQYQSIGKSFEGRDLPLLTVSNPKTGPDAKKSAMWIDGNVHGNEVQGAECSLYAMEWLLDHYGTTEKATKLLDERVFYVLPMQNPDGRAHWFEAANDNSSSRSGVRPTDNDGDGLFDEDPPDDLDGDGNITQMRKYVPGEGDYRLDPDDPRIMIRPPPGKKGDWILLGDEGIDNDGDGRVNEDDVGGYDMNRNWPSGWLPNFVQFGAGEWPLCFPECKAIADFILAHPNIAAVQSFHNNGGMILRGPGYEGYGEYPRADNAVYDEIGKDGEKMLPFYRYMVIWRDLYTVYGGFVNWTYEGLGIFSFTNEMWNGGQYFQKQDGAPSGDEGERFFNDKVLLGDAFVAWHPYKHPLYGDIEIGGDKKMTGRVPPNFMIEEMLHRNAAFCWYHADAMPEVAIRNATVAKLGGDVFTLELTVANSKLIPTRSALAAQKKMGRPDLLTVGAADGGDGVKVLSAAYVSDRFRKERDEMIDDKTPQQLRIEQGLASRGELKLRYVLRGKGDVKITYDAEKGGVAEASAKLE